MTSRTRVVVLVGANRSGTTVLAALLGSLPGAFNGGEIAHLWDRGIALNELCGYGEAFRECPVWSRITGPTHEDDVAFVREVQPGLDRLRMVPALLRGGFRTERERLGAILGRTYRRIQEVTGSRVIVDSSKRLSYALLLRDAVDLEVSVIHVVRDPYAVSYSKRRRRRRPEIVESEAWMGRSPAWRSALKWVAVNAAVRTAGARFDGFWRVRAEDYVRRPDLVLYGMERLGLASQGGSLSDVEIDVGSQHTVSGNPVRFSTEPLRLREDLEYVEGMRFLDRAVVTALCWPWLRAYGYRWGGGVREGG